MATRSTGAPTLGPQEGRLFEGIRRSGRAVIVVRRDRALFEGFNPNQLRLLLKRLADDGWLHRVERGVYAVAPQRGLRTQPPLALLADWLEGERYVVAGFFALAHWSLTPFPASTIMCSSIVGARACATARRSSASSTSRATGSRPIATCASPARARVATPERALTDVLAGRRATRLETARQAFTRGLRDGILHRRRLLEAAREAPSAAARRLGWIAQHEHDALTPRLMAIVGNEGYVPLDPRRDTTDARRNTDWRVLENVVIP